MGSDIAIPALLVGAIVVLAMAGKALLDRWRLPAMLAYLGIGLLLGALNGAFDFLGEHPRWLLEVLAEWGVVALLFRVGLESNFDEMRRQAGPASGILLANIAVSGGLGYAAGRYVLGLNLVPSLLFGAALTATSVGVPSAVWQRRGKIDKPLGQLFVDVAEMDDIAGVVILGLLFAILPALREGDGSLWATLGAQTGLYALRLAGFGLLCWFFSRYCERRMTHCFESLESPPDPMILVAGVGLIIASLAGLIGFSMAIGAFFAGVVFSRDPDAVKMSGSFDSIYDLLVPFFFVHIGFVTDLGVLGAAWWPALVLVVAAIAGKLLGTGLPVWPRRGAMAGVILGVSMVPRAEIAMIIMQRALAKGPEVMPQRVYAGMVAVVIVTCLAGPLVLRPLLDRHFE